MLNEMFTTEMASSYRDAMTEEILRRDQERSALVEALVCGRVADTATVWEAADLLALPYQGLFAVVAAEAPLARHALPNIECRLRDRGTGRSVDDPLGAVELYIAIQTMLRLPKPAEQTEVSANRGRAGAVGPRISESARHSAYLDNTTSILTQEGKEGVADFRRVAR